MSLTYRLVSFAWCKVIPCTFCEHSSKVYNVLDLSSLTLNHYNYSHIEVCNNSVQHPMGNSPDLRSNVILECINNLGIVSIDPVFRYPHRK